MSVPDLFVLTVAFLALKKWFFWKKKFPKKMFVFYLFFYATFQCGRYGVFKKNLKKILTPKKWKNGPQKLLIIGPDPLISQSSPDQRPTAQNWFFILGIVGTRHLFSYLCLCPGPARRETIVPPRHPLQLTWSGLLVYQYIRAYCRNIYIVKKGVMWSWPNRFRHPE